MNRTLTWPTAHGSVRVLIPAAELPVRLEDARAQCRIDGIYADDQLSLLVSAACDHAQGFLRRGLGQQSLELRCAGWPLGGLLLPFGPVLSVQGVSYLPAGGGDLAALPEASWRLDDWHPVPRILPTPGASWPAVQDDVHAVRVAYTAGWTAETLPPVVRQSLLLMVGAGWLNRDGAAAAEDAAAVELAERRMTPHALEWGL